MLENRPLFLKIITALHEAEVLENLVLIGSWCLPIYSRHFNDPPEIPLLRTVDIDFLIPNPPRIKAKADLPALLKRFGFDEAYSPLGGFSKFVHPELEIEFLTPERGRGKDKPYQIEALKISAQGLRYLGLAQDFSIELPYEGIKVRVPEPGAFVLLKILTSGKRPDRAKQERDMSTAKQLGEYLIRRPGESARLREIFAILPRPWQSSILKVCKELSPAIFEALTP
jgi:hypothetical protein